MCASVSDAIHKYPVFRHIVFVISSFGGCDDCRHLPRERQQSCPPHWTRAVESAASKTRFAECMYIHQRPEGPSLQSTGEAEGRSRRLLQYSREPAIIGLYSNSRTANVKKFAALI